MRRDQQLIKAAIETLIYEGMTRELAQVEALITLSRIAASSGPKNLQRLVVENKEVLVAGLAEDEFETPPAPICETYLAVPVSLIRNAINWLAIHNTEERNIANQLNALLTKKHTENA